MDWPRRPASQPNTGKVKCTGKVFTVKMRHHRGDQACAVDTVGMNIKGLNKNDMPQCEDVMGPLPQILEQIVDVGGQEQVIVREIPEVLVVERSRNERTIAILRTSRVLSRAWASVRFFGASTTHSFDCVPVEAVGHFANSSSIAVDTHTRCERPRPQQQQQQQAFLLQVCRCRGNLLRNLSRRHVWCLRCWQWLRAAEKGAPAPLVASTRADDRAHGVDRGLAPLCVQRCRVRHARRFTEPEDGQLQEGSRVVLAV